MSSASTFSSILRTIIMMAFLMAIPLIAVCGPSLPQMFMQLLEKQFPVLAQANATAVPPPAEQPPQFEPLRPDALAMPHSLAGGQPQGMAANGLDALGDDRSAVKPTAYDAPVDNPAGFAGLPSQRTDVPTPGPGAAMPDPFAAATASAAEIEPTDLRALAGRDASAGSPRVDPAAAVGGRSDQFAQFEKRLREMGATYLLLESWGTQQQLYRFYCKMAVGGNPNCTKHFEATNADPLAAMSIVLKQVEEWLSSQSAT